MEPEHIILMAIIGFQLILLVLLANYQDKKNRLWEAKFNVLIDGLKMHRIEIDRLNLNEAKRVLEKEREKSKA